MTSKEALEKLKGYLGLDTKIIELLIPIAKDLEMLEKLKSQFTIEKAEFSNDEIIYFNGNYIGTIEHEEQLEYLDEGKELLLLKIKEWLENADND